MSGGDGIYTPTVVGVRSAYCAGADPIWTESAGTTPYRTQADMEQEFDRWLAEHDHAVRTRWEMTRKPDPIIIENIQGEPAAVWMLRQRAEAWDEGYGKGQEDWTFIERDRTTNPYREQS